MEKANNNFIYFYVYSKSNLSTLYLRNGLFIVRCCIQHIIQAHGETTLLEHFNDASSFKNSNSSHTDYDSTSIRDNKSNQEGTLRSLLSGVFTLLGEIALV